jgi:LysM repeat protein
LKKKIAATLALLLVLSGVAVSSPSALKVDTVSAATAEEGSTTAPATTTTKPTTTKPATTKTTKPAATTTKTTVVKATGSVYVVKKGDNLWNIARKNGLTLVQLLNLNPQIKITTILHVGQQIVVAKAAADLQQVLQPLLQRQM